MTSNEQVEDLDFNALVAQLADSKDREEQDGYLAMVVIKVKRKRW